MISSQSVSSSSKRLSQICQRSRFFERMSQPRYSPFRMVSGVDSRPDVPGHVDEDDALGAFEQDEPLQDFGALVVQRIVVPVPLHQLGHDHRDLTAGVFGF